MAAIRVDGTVEFEGRIVKYDIDEFGTPNTWTLGEMYFITHESTDYRSMGNPIHRYKRHYVNEHVAILDGEPVDIAEVRRLFGGTYGITYQRRQVYKNVNIDAPDSVKEFYETAKNAENMFRHTLVKFMQICEPQLKRDVRIKKGPNAGVEGYVCEVYEATDILNRRCDVLCMEDGETYTVVANNLEVLKPMQYLSGQTACLDCYNVFDHPAVVWIQGDIESPRTGAITKWNRPVCGYCLDWYMDAELFPMDQDYKNLTGPYVYGEDQFETCFVEPGVIPLTNVNYERQRPRPRVGFRNNRR